MPEWVGNFFIFIFVISIASKLNAAEINFASNQLLFISGEIVDGDYRKLIIKIAENENSGKAFLIRPNIVINSNGGSLSEAQKIGSLISDIHANVTVGRKCHSACFWVIAAASRRNLHKIPNLPRPEIGLHNVYLDRVTSSSMTATQLALAIKQANESARTSLEKLEVPSYLIDKMASKTSVELYYLTDEDIINLGNFPPSVNQARVSKCNADPVSERQFTEVLMGLSSRMPSIDNEYFERVNSCWNRLWRESSAENFKRHLSLVN